MTFLLFSVTVKLKKVGFYHLYTEAFISLAATVEEDEMKGVQ